VSISTGEYNNYRSEILDEGSFLYEAEPDFVVVIPDERTCMYTGNLNDPRERVAAEVDRSAADLLDLCSAIREKCSAEIFLCNYILPSTHDLGPFRTKGLASAWSFKKSVNLSLGANAPNYVHICDLEFLAYQIGGRAAKDERAWFESKQMCSPDLQVALAKEIAHLIGSIKTSPKKVLALDLDNTLWGGVVGDDGLDGIEIGDTSPRGEAFKAFQTYILSLIDRGVLLAVCSKNDFENAIEPFRSHPEMVLREEHFVSFKANWEPKGRNLVAMAEELDLGLDSFIFVDDNPAEVENVRQFAPEVTSILLGPDPSYYVRELQDSRLFERLTITSEDGQRTRQYRTEATRRSHMANAASMESYLESLEMVGTLTDFNSIDMPRLVQLINKSNQFNLTTKRRTEAELAVIMSDPRYSCFSMRLKDRFGDHGLISVVICKDDGGGAFEIDTWLMSCRVLKRQVEECVLNEIVDRANSRGCDSIRGFYIPTAKNGMVKDLFPRFGFEAVSSSNECSEYRLSTDGFMPIATKISIEGRND
jgi:FkbH-like protein